MRDLNRDWALRLAEAGIAVFPCGPDKKPLVKWRAESSCDANTIAEWWRQFPNALPGIDLGKSDLVVLDGDRHGGPDGRTALRNLLRQQADFASRSAPTVLTPSDGVHVYFRQNGHALTNSRGDLPDGIDVRGTGGYVIAYAVLPDGRQYQTAPNALDLISTFRAGTIPHVPQGIVDLIRARKEPPQSEPLINKNAGGDVGGGRETAWAQAALDGAAAELARRAEGGRNEALNATAYRLGRMVARGWLERAQVEAALTAAMHANGYAGEEGDKRITETLKNGLEAGMAAPHPDLVERDEQTRTSRESGKTNSNASGEQQECVITLQGGKLDEAATKAEAALIAARAPFYIRDGEIVRPIIEEVRAFRGRKTKIVRLRPVTTDMLRDHLSRVARFMKYDARARKPVDVDPPHDVANTIIARDGDWRFPALAGVITTPTMRSDGSILSEPGYDPPTKLLLVAPPSMPAIPEQPSRDDALAALGQLDVLLNEFPFINDASRTVALSVLMTPVARGAMPVVPMHAADAPEAGTGKSYLFDIAAAIATGEIAPATAAGRNEEETEKRLVAELMTGQPIISIDNLNGELGGDLLCQAIERGVIKPRILGRSETRRIENTVTIFGNGNNFRVVGDMVRRVILCTMDANLERPELRQFRSDPVAMVLADRGRYVAAVLTIVRAYLAAGCPDLLPPIASFQDWSRLIRSPLVWLGRADPVDTMETVRADDGTRSNLRAVVAAWLAVIGPNCPLTAGAIRDKACSAANSDLTLNKAISAVACAPGRSEIDAIRLGRWLGRNKGRVVDGVKIFGEKDKHSKQMVWWLATTGETHESNSAGV